MPIRGADADALCQPDAMSEQGDPGRLATLVTGGRATWLVIVFWLVALGICLVPATGLSQAQENDVASWLPGDAESTRAIDAQEKFFSPDSVPTVVVYEREHGEITPSDRRAVQRHARAFALIDHVRGQPGTELSPDREAMTATVVVDPGTGGWETLLEVTDEIRELEQTLPTGLSMHVTGPGGTAADFMDAFSGGDRGVMLAALGVVVIALLLTYRSPTLWLLPVIAAVVSLVVAMAVVRGLVGADLLTVNGQTLFILPVLVFGAATDYALLLIARYREELRHHEDRHRAMAVALHRAGPAIVASGVTVVIGLLCLMAASMTPTASLGPVCAIGVLVGLAAMLTLLPALLLACGRRVFWPARPAYGSEDHTADSVWARVGTSISRRPRTVWVVTALLLGGMALGGLGLEAKGLTNENSFTTTPDSVTGSRVLARHFDAGTGTPVYVFADSDAGEEVREAVAEVDGIHADTVAEAGRVDGTVMVVGGLRDRSDTEAARDTVERVRAAVHGVDGADALVTGDAAQQLDMLEAQTRDNQVVIPLVLLVVLLVLCALLRSLVAPLLLLGTVVLSFFAALGLSTLLFEHVLGFEGADSAYPLWSFVFLVALGIDYNIFLMSRVHEESKRVGTREGALVGLRATGGVITAAGLVLAGTFAVLATLPMVFAAQIGVTVALGVLLDTLVVRSVLVTALTLDVGPRMWWPSALSRDS